MHTQPRDELLAMEAKDLRVRAELLAEGSLGDGYHPRMREVYERNTARSGGTDSPVILPNKLERH